MNSQSSFSYGAAEWIKRVLLLSLAVIICAQASLHIITDIFVISLGTVCLTALAYYFDDMPLMPVAIISGTGVVLTRVLVDMIQGSSLESAFETAFPEIIFYIMMGIFLLILGVATGHSRKLYIFIPCVIVFDYFSNALELFSRIQQDSYNLRSQLMLMVVALIRGGILLLILLFMDRYRVMLLSRSHAERYHRLIMQTSRLKGEVIWMNKNREQIEDTMSTAYNLYEKLSERDEKEEADEALTIAKDIHEIKKEYILISRGLEEAGEEGGEIGGMQMNELFTILIRSMKEEFADSDRELTIMTQIEDNLYTSEPYLFLSIFHNLISNAMEASDKAFCNVMISEMYDPRSRTYVYSVTDNGPGVPEKYRDKIFKPRFSTKINYETGSVNRGLGLSIVKDIVEQKLGGIIKLENSRHGASFIFTVPEEKMEAVK